MKLKYEVAKIMFYFVRSVFPQISIIFVSCISPKHCEKFTKDGLQAEYSEEGSNLRVPVAFAMICALAFLHSKDFVAAYQA